MRNIIFIITSLAFSIQFYGQDTSKKIVLTEIDLASEPLKMIDYPSAIEKRIKYGLESYDYTRSSDSLVYTNLHPMIAALHYSFADHRPVIISPDMIWLLITQSFALHIDQNPEKYRDLIVGFKDKKTIQVNRNDFRKGELKNPWHETFPIFSDSIKTYIGASLHKTLVPKFSTTGVEEKSAFEISLMDATSNYFEYDFTTFCGIPYIILQGNPSDWLWIVENVDFFNSFGLDFWIDKIKPITEEIYQSSLGNHNKEFWKDIYKWHEASGGNIVNGWITDFFLYTEQSDKYMFNDFIFMNRDSLVVEYGDRGLQLLGMRGNEFPSGLSKVDFKWLYMIEPTDTFEMAFFAGFIGINQNIKTLELKPEISFAIVDKKSKPLQNANIAIVDNYQPSCNSFLFDIKGINQLPIFHPDINYNDYRKSEDSFKKFLSKQVSEFFPSRLEKHHFAIAFTVSKSGLVKDVKIESSAGKEINDYLEKTILSTKDWKPAIIQGEKEDYELKIRCWI